MSSNWFKGTLKYALLLTPAAALTGLLALVAMGAWVATILREPARYSDAPVLIQKLTRSAYWHTRRHWHTVPECVLFDPELLYRPRPGECVFENSEFRTTMHFEENGGRRTAAPDPHAAAHGPRVIIVGDSHAMGWGVEDAETFASVLASEYGFHTVNLAVSSYATPRELRRLERDFPLQEDDIVLIQYCDNDLSENRHFTRTGKVGPYTQAELDRLFNYPRVEVSAVPIAGLLLRQSWNRAMDSLLPGRKKEAKDAPDASTAFLHVLHANAVLKGHRVIVVALNASGQKTHLERNALQTTGLTLIEPQFSAGDFFDIDDHMRPSGHRAVASAIAEVLSTIAGLSVANSAD